MSTTATPVSAEKAPTEAPTPSASADEVVHTDVSNNDGNDSSILKKYPCPVCGYHVFPGPSGTYEICPVCDWEDSLLQAQHPRMQGVANGFCIFGKQQFDYRRKWVLPQPGNDNEGLERDPGWRLLRPDEAPLAKDQSATDCELDYYAGAPPYYWRMPPASS